MKSMVQWCTNASNSGPNNECGNPQTEDRQLHAMHGDNIPPPSFVVEQLGDWEDKLQYALYAFPSKSTKAH